MRKILLTLLMAFTLLAGFSASAETGQGLKPININTASKEELLALPGIGEAKADAIIEQRQKHAFTAKEDLLVVKGIGDKLLEKIAPYVAVEKATGALKAAN